MKYSSISGKGRRGFLKTTALAIGLTVGLGSITTSASHAAVGEPEKEDLKFGFIKLTDMAPLAIAYEKGFFEDEGLYVTLEAQANWKVLLDRVIDGELIANAYDDRFSQLSMLLFLSDGYEGGATQFLVSESDSTLPARNNADMQVIDVRTPLGGVLCFPHGNHPLHCLHASQQIESGCKYIIRWRTRRNREKLDR